jgi:hypothetical protein
MGLGNATSRRIRSKNLLQRTIPAMQTSWPPRWEQQGLTKDKRQHHANRDETENVDIAL